jgi:hypothetical protein
MDWVEEFVHKKGYHDTKRVLQECRKLCTRPAHPWRPHTGTYCNQHLLALSNCTGTGTTVTLWLPISFPIHPPIAVVKPREAVGVVGCGGDHVGVDWQGRLHQPSLSQYNGDLLRVEACIHNWLSALPVSVSGGTGSSRKSPNQAVSVLRDRLCLKLNRLRVEAEREAMAVSERVMSEMRVVEENRKETRERQALIMERRNRVDVELATITSMIYSFREKIAFYSNFTDKGDQRVVWCEDAEEEQAMTAYILDTAISDTLQHLFTLFSERRSGSGSLLDYLQTVRQLARRQYRQRVVWLRLLNVDSK